MKNILSCLLILFFAAGCAGKKAPVDILSIDPETQSSQEEVAQEEPIEKTLDYFDHEKELKLSEKGAEPTFDIPMVMNERVGWWIRYFQKDGSKFFRAWLSRSEKYIPMMKRILREAGLPEDLIYLAMIESGFKPYAYSRAKASGPWQFISRTGQRYGLKVNWCIDERRDPEKSTIAAAQHLKDLYDEFDHWYLAAAGYNAGAGKIKKAISKYSTEDFWEMSKYRYLRRETKDYVPKMIAAATIAKSPGKYGFNDIQFEEPLEYDKVVVSKPTDLRSIAQALDTSYETIKNLNPELLRWFTPPNYPNYELKIPKGKSDMFAANQPQMKSVMITSTVAHRLKSGETLSHIAKSYGTSVNSLLAFNDISNPRRIRAGQVIHVPVMGARVTARSSQKHVLEPGENLSTVATTHGISLNELLAANDIRNPESVQAGQVINLPGVHRNSSYKSNKIDAATYRKKINEKGAVGYTVKSGDTIWSISRAFNVTVSEIRKWNAMGSVRMIHPGNKLVIYPRFTNGNSSSRDSSPASIAKNEKAYTVKKGDTLWGISKEHNIPVSNLVSLNNLGKDKTGIKPGDVLKLYD